ncbi:ATP-binding cassette domain-containing protein [Paenibacillus sp. PR3]|uniref:ATP-binding cassette domain-containing protein n=1 Tax=Paenibacillus terricola TaxID=2763503 RepID=A0ABR8MUX4_9BACL|nr:ATP-binding cassette domain-containing protein [Paenibacillus terricola]MBD3918329.1 ATP-binding cassette domain-containing protein [Paenibacillus terricola]
MRSNGSLHVHDLSVLVDGKTIVNALSAAFPAGRITLIVGHNGAGKSTVLETLAGLREPAGGIIQLADQQLWLKKKLNKEYLMQIGVSLQQSSAQWFLSTVADEFRYSMRPYQLSGEEMNARMEDALAAVGLESERFLERDPKTLSGGQQRRLSLAMLAACQPQWLLLDEPTAGLDADGIQQLCVLLMKHRAAGGSAIIVAHDLEVLLPISDAVLEIDNGSAVSIGIRPAVQYAASLAASTDSGPLPQPLETAAFLHQAGIKLPASDEAWMEPKALAAALTQQLLSGDHHAVAQSGSQAIVNPPDRPDSITDSEDAAVLITAANPSIQHTNRQAPRSNTRVIPSDRFDPRAVVLSYLLFATGILLQQNWWGLLVATLFASAFVWWPLRYTITPWRNAIILYIRMVIVFILFAGIKLTSIGYDWHPVVETGFRLSKLLVVMVTGLPIAALVTPIRLQRAIEQSLGWLRKIKLPIDALALTVALIFRFLPMIKQEWERFVRIAHARGKSTTRPGKLPARMLYAITAPFMLAMLRGADEMTDALEARGYGRMGGSTPTRGIVLRWSISDSKLTVVFGILFAILYWL